MAQIGSPTSYEKSILTALHGGGDFLAAAAGTVLKLFKNNFVPGPGSTAADFTEADFTGYASIAIASWAAPALDAVSGRWYLSPSAGVESFTQTGVVSVNTVYGFFMINGPGDLICFERFDTPVEMDTNGKVLSLLMKINATGLEGADALED